MKRIIFTFLLLSTFSVQACVCGPLRLSNLFSGIDFVARIKFNSLEKIENSYGLYRTQYEVIEQFVGNEKIKLFINSQEGSSCSFVPELNTEYFIIAHKNEHGFVETSYCLSIRFPDKKLLSQIRELVKLKIPLRTSRNIRQITKQELNSRLFDKTVSGAFIYQVNMNSEFTVSDILPVNTNAKNNFDKNIKKELIQKFEYVKMNESSKIEKKNLTTFIILSWRKDYEGRNILDPTKI